MGKTQMIEQESAKTKFSMRTLPLVGSFKEYFQKVKEAQTLNKKVCGNCYNYEYDGFVFVDEMGRSSETRLSDHTISRFYSKERNEKDAFPRSSPQLCQPIAG